MTGIFFIGVVIILIGVIMLVKAQKEKKKKMYSARVVGCLEVVSCRQYNITVEMDTETGYKEKMITCIRPYSEGDSCQVRYDSNKDEYRIIERYTEIKTKDCLAAIGIGLVWCLLIGSAMVAEKFETAGDSIALLWGYILCISFVLFGIYGALIKPISRKKELKDCRIIPGSVVSYSRERNSNGKFIYCPIYSFDYEGEQQKMNGRVRGNSKKYCQIGRKVQIAINNKTGETFCIEDEKDIRWICFVAGLFGVIFLIILLIR